MRAIIHNIMSFYEMRAKALDVLVANTQKALSEFGPDRERKTDEQAERIENFVKDLTMNVNNMLTRFWFQKEHKQMTGEQTKTLVDFVNFVKTLTKNVRLLLTCFQKSQMFEEKLDREIEEIETHVKQRLKEFDEALSGTSDTRVNRLSRYVGNIAVRTSNTFKSISRCKR